MQVPDVYPDAILFDWDNTLVDTWGLIYQAMNETLRKMSLQEWSLDQVKHNAIRSSRETFPQIFGKRSDEARAIYLKFYKTFRKDHLIPLPGAKELLDFCKDKNLLTSIVSNKERSILDQEIAMMGWQDAFAAVVGAGDCEHDKPAPDPAFLALKLINIQSPTRVWFVGDVQTDMECAERAGCLAVGFGLDLTSRKIAVKNCYELLSLLKRLGPI